jgi:hypothetical protein
MKLKGIGGKIEMKRFATHEQWGNQEIVTRVCQST